MKATVEVPDELFRAVKAKSALEGRTLREVAEALFRRYVSGEEPAVARAERLSTAAIASSAGERVPAWFGALGRQAHLESTHDLDAVRHSIAAGIARERKL